MSCVFNVCGTMAGGLHPNEVRACLVRDRHRRPGDEKDSCGDNPCDVNALCEKTGAGTFTCTCRDGYIGSGVQCQEVDPCVENPCDPHAKCTKTGPGGFSCACNTGRNGDGKTCKAQDVCESDDPCDENAICYPTGPGTFTCQCKAGYNGNGTVCDENQMDKDISDAQAEHDKLLDEAEKKLKFAQEKSNPVKRMEGVTDKRIDTIENEIDSLEKIAQDLIRQTEKTKFRHEDVC